MMKSANMVVACVLAMVILSGCFSIARYQANVRPNTVKPCLPSGKKYRLERILLNTKDFAEMGAVTEDEYVEMCWMMEALTELDENTKKAYAQLPPEAYDKVREIAVNPDAFDAFAKRFVEERPIFRSSIRKFSMSYHDALETNDTDARANSAGGIAALYYGLDATKKMVADFKKGYAKVNDPYYPRWTMKDRFKFHAKYKFEAIKKLGMDSEVASMYKDAVKQSLVRNYPAVFTETSDAIPVTVLVSWDKKFDDHHSYGGLLCIFGFPLTQEIETTYRVRVITGNDRRSADELWNEYACSLLEYPPPSQNGGAVRQREMWTSFFLPISLIGIPGESDWPKERKYFTTGSTTITKQRDAFSGAHGIFGVFGYYSPIEYMEEFVFDPVCDGDIIAALIMRSLNKIEEEKD